MRAHDAIVAQFADEAGFLAIVSPKMLVVDYARREAKPLTKRRPIEYASEVNPFAAVLRPRLATERFLNTSLNQCIFKWL